MKYTRQISNLILFIFGLLLTIIACRKQDYTNDHNKQFLKDQFFKLPANTHLDLQNVASEIKKQDDKYKFIETFIQQNGLPKWENTITNLSTVTQGTSNNNDSLIFFIPIKTLNEQEITSYIVCLKVNTSYNFRLYRKKNLDSIQTNNQYRKQFLKTSLSLFAHFEKQINQKDSLFIEGIYKKHISKTNISFNASSNFTNKQISKTSYNIYSVEMCYRISCGTEQQTTKTLSLGACFDCYTYWYIDWSGGGGSSNTGWWDNGGGGGTPASGSISTAFEYLVNNLNLNSTQQLWLAESPFETQQICQALQESLNQDPIAENAFPTSPSPEALAAAQITVEAAMNGLIYGQYTIGHYNLIKQYIPGSQNHPNIDPVFWAYFSLRCALIKAEHPEYSSIRVYWEVMKDIVHVGLDVVGLFPLVGEVADLLNGAVYTLEGDGVNATLSYASAIPVAGWFSSGIKFAKKGVDLANGSKTTLKWIKRTDNLIDFGERSQLRTVLGLAKGDARIAHHIIPWARREHNLIQKAAQGNNAFHMNELLNGIPISTLQHNYGHPGYITKVLTKLDNLWSQNGGSSMSPHMARQLVEQLVNDIKATIQNNPNTVLDNLNF